MVSGRWPTKRRGAEVLYRGIAGRAFERRFVLADHIVVEGADLQNGLLHVGLKRVVPEALKPRKIAIGGGAGDEPGDRPCGDRQRAGCQGSLTRPAIGPYEGAGQPAPFSFPVLRSGKRSVSDLPDG